MIASTMPFDVEVGMSLETLGAANATIAVAARRIDLKIGFMCLFRFPETANMHPKSQMRNITNSKRYEIYAANQQATLSPMSQFVASQVARPLSGTLVRCDDSSWTMGVESP